MPRQLSLIDLTDYDNRKDEIAEQLLHAASDAGFFWVTGHGISQEEVQLQFANGDRFLNLEDSQKSFAKFRPELFMGWRGLSDTKAAVGTSSWEQFLIAFNDTYMQGIWPKEEDLPDFKASALAFARKANAVALQILSCFEHALQLPDGYFEHHLDPHAGDNQTLFGWNHYPDPLESNLLPDQLRLLPHADTDVITLLFQKPGEPGLEILPGKDADQHAVNDPSGKDSYGLNGAWTGGIPQGNWTKMDPIPGAITVNIGNMLMRLSDNKLKSTYHRVRALEGAEASAARRSMVLFVHGRGSAIMQGPQKAYPAQTVAEMIAMNGKGYEKVKEDKEWQHLVMQSQPHDQGAEPTLIEVA